MPRSLARAISWLVPLVWIALLGAACDRRPSVVLVDVPHPELDRFDAAVQEQIRAVQAQLAQRNETPGTPPESLAQAYGQTGMVYQAYAIHDAAEACYRNAEALARDELRWSYYLGHVLRKNGDADEARAAFLRALALDAHHVPSLLQAVELELDAGRVDEAGAHLRRALEVAPESPAVQVAAGKVASALGDTPGAIAAYEQALRLAPGANEVEYLLGQAYRKAGDAARARDHLARWGKRSAPLDDPLMAEIDALVRGASRHHKFGAAYYREGLYARALEEFRAVVAADPLDAMARLNLGSTLIRLGDREGGRRELGEATRLDPHLAIAHFDLGVLAAQEHRDDDAIGHYREALAADAGLTQARFNLANTLRRHAQPEEAAGHFGSVVETEPGNAAARLGEVLSLAALDRWSEAVGRAEEGLRAVPGDRGLRDALARILAACPVDAVRDGSRALEIARSLLAEERSLSHAQALAKAAAEVGQFDVAVDWQVQAVTAAGGSGRSDLLPGLEADLRLFRQRRASRTPWARGETEGRVQTAAGK